MMATARGIVKKTPLGAFSRPRPSGIIAVNLDPDDSLIGCALSSGSDEVILATRRGLAIRFSEQNVRAMGRTARGVKGISLGRDDQVVAMAIAKPSGTLLTVCENGYGKRTAFDQYRLQGRGGKGVINIRTTQRNGQVVGLKTVTDEDELMMITVNGMMLRTPIAGVRVIGRATQGVRLIRPQQGDKVVAVARIAKDQHESNGQQGPDDEQQDAPERPENDDAEPQTGEK